MSRRFNRQVAITWHSVGFLFCLLLSLPSFAEQTRLVINGKVFTVELAITEQERRQGLMHRSVLATDQGMLFVYSEPTLLSFWMKDTLIALDLLFFNTEGELVEKKEDVQPCLSTPCKNYRNKQPAQFVLELPAGSAKMLELNRGDKFYLHE